MIPHNINFLYAETFKKKFKASQRSIVFPDNILNFKYNPFSSKFNYNMKQYLNNRIISNDKMYGVYINNYWYFLQGDYGPLNHLSYKTKTSAKQDISSRILKIIKDINFINGEIDYIIIEMQTTNRGKILLTKKKYVLINKMRNQLHKLENALYSPNVVGIPISKYF